MYFAWYLVLFKTPKRNLPSFELDMISIKGSYSGASVDILDKMAVTEIEDNIKILIQLIQCLTIVSPGGNLLLF